MSIVVKTLFEEYKKTREWEQLSDNSKIMYGQMMKYAETDYFLMVNKVDRIDEPMVDDLYVKLIKKKSLAHATAFMSVMRRIWGVMRRRKKVKINPFREMTLNRPPAREIRWDKVHVNLYVDYLWNKKEYELSLLVRLCYELAQRPGDMRNLTRENFNADFSEVKFTQQKTKKRMHLPIRESVRKYLKAMGDFNPLVTMEIHKLGALHRETLKELGLPDNYQLRDLRRTALIEVMEAGATDAEGQSIGGHEDRQSLNVYSPSSLLMAQHAMAKRFGENTT